MLRYKLTKDSDTSVLYEYFPECKEVSGVVSFDKRTNTGRIENLAANDSKMIYALKMMKKVQKMASNGTFKREGLVSWY